MKLVNGRLNKREVFICLFTFTLVFIFYFGVYSNKQHLEIEVLNLDLQKVIVDLNSNQDKLLQSRSQSNKNLELTKVMSSNEQFGDFLKHLSGEQGLFLVNKLNVLEQENSSTFIKSKISLEVETSFLNLGKFIEEMEKSNYLIEITGVEVTRISEELRKCTAKIFINNLVARR